MAAYAALVSLLHIIDQIKLHPRPPVSLPLDLVQSLTDNVNFLQGFLEKYSLQAGYRNEADPLEMRIADAAYEAEDVIESHIADQILGSGSGSTSRGGERASSVDFNERLQKVIVKMEDIKLKTVGVQDQHLRNSSLSGGSIKSSFVAHNAPMVGFDDILPRVMSRLTSWQSDRQVIPIVGMGGIGKTTLVRHLYSHPSIRNHFYCFAWVTISQEYNTREILKVIFSQVNKESSGYSSEYRIGERLYQCLWRRRYLIVLDDMWSAGVWDEVRAYFPDDENGSRIMMTTRLSNLAFLLTGSYGFQMKFLEEDKSWNLLCQIVFGRGDGPVELEGIGRKIVKNCKGLPLSIVVIGGLLAKHPETLEYWEYILDNTSSAISLEDDEHCLQILYTSYKELPVHLKPCFLYLGIFQEDSEIRVCDLIKLWVAEGFLKKIDGKSSEVVAEEFFMELVNRNVILVHELGSTGKPKLCKIHDLVKDLCLREAQQQKFLCVRKPYNLCSPKCVINTERRLVIHGSKAREEYDPAQVLNAVQSASLCRSLIINYESDDFENVIRKANLRLLRVFKVEKTHTSSNTRNFYLNHKLCNLRYFSAEGSGIHVKLSGGFYWNLQTLLCRNMSVVKFTEIWQMPLLRCVKLKYLSLPDPPTGGTGERDDFALRNLQMLSEITISNFRENVVKRIQNIKKLRIRVDDGESPDCFNNLEHLHALQHLNCQFVYLESAIIFPPFLKKLTLESNGLSWEDLTAMIGSLPVLEVLKLKGISSAGFEWATDEGQFCSLRYLLIEQCDELVSWKTEDSHFPRLEHLRLKYLNNLEKIPLTIGEIPTLESIELEWCSDSAEASAKEIQEDQLEYGNKLRVVII